MPVKNQPLWQQSQMSSQRAASIIADIEDSPAVEVDHGGHIDEGFNVLSQIKLVNAIRNNVRLVNLSRLHPQILATYHKAFFKAITLRNILLAQLASGFPEAPVDYQGNPLPMDVVDDALPFIDKMRTQLFQNNTLDFSGCYLGDAGAIDLARILKQQPRLWQQVHHLNLANKFHDPDHNSPIGIGPAGIQALMSLDDFGKVKTLNLSHNPLGMEGIQALAGASCAKTHEQLPKKLRHLHKLSLAGTLGSEENPNSERMITSLSQLNDLVRRNSKLQLLNLSRCNLQPTALRILKKAIYPHRHLRHLYLGHNNLRDAGAVQVALAISREGSCLQLLDIQANEIGKRGGKALAAAFAGHELLNHVWLDHNPLHNSNERQLSKILKKKNQLTISIHSKEFAPDNTDAHSIKAIVDFQQYSQQKRQQALQQKKSVNEIYQPKPEPAADLHTEQVKPTPFARAVIRQPGESLESFRQRDNEAWRQGVEQIRKEREANPPPRFPKLGEARILGKEPNADMLELSMGKINQYILLRESETWSKFRFFGCYSHQDYIDRARSWERILRAMQAPNLSREQLLKTINFEAKRFRHGYRQNFSQSLQELNRWVERLPPKSDVGIYLPMGFVSTSLYRINTKLSDCRLKVIAATEPVQRGLMIN